VTVDPEPAFAQQARAIVVLQVLVVLLIVGAAVTAAITWPAAGPAILVGAGVLGVLLLIVKF
jgi:hypothetical protein